MNIRTVCKEVVGFSLYAIFGGCFGGFVQLLVHHASFDELIAAPPTTSTEYCSL
jgi:hypothetical protein